MLQSSLKISIERLLEQEVDEINRNGEETYIKPFTLSEELSYHASKIDFHGTHEDLLREDEEEETTEAKKPHVNGNEKIEAEGEDEDKKQAERWPWEDVYSKIRIALSEMCVMLDVLECLHRKKYLVLDPVQQNAEPSKQMVQLLGRRKCLAVAGVTITSGAGSLSIKNKSPRVEPFVDGVIPNGKDENHKDEYYIQLMHLRQYWRVKKTGVQITGDVTYKSVGSKFWHPGLFEVKVAHSVANDVDQRNLDINISPDLLQKSILKVEIVDKTPGNEWVAITDMPQLIKKESIFDWENSLELAQTHLFNLEIFSLLSNEAFQGSYHNIEILNNKICCRLDEDADIFIVHTIGEDAAKPEIKSEKGVLKAVCANDITLIIKSLLLAYYGHNVNSSSLYPATSNHYQRPLDSSSVHNQINKARIVKPRNSILFDFLEQVKHKLMLTRVMNFLDKKSLHTTHSTIQIHWSTLKLHSQSTCSVLIITKSYAVTITTCLLLTINNDGIHITFETAEKLTMPFDLQLLEDVLNIELKSQLIKISNILCVQHGWCLIQSSSKNSLITTGPTTQGGMHNGSIFYSSHHKRFLKLLIIDLDNFEIQVSVHQDESISLILDEKFRWLNMKYVTVPWENIPGKIFAERIENLFLSL